VARHDDAFEAFRASNPVDDSTLPDADSTDARALFSEITSRSRTMPEADKHPRRQLVLVIAVAILALGLVAAAWLIFRDVSDPISVACYQDTSLGSNVVAASPDGPLEASLCEQVWEEGTLVNEAVVPAGQAPPLVGCVTDQGNLAVFPSEDPSICAQLGLAEPTPSSPAEGDTIRQLDNDLVEYFSQHECQTIEQARLDIQQLLDGYGLSEWIIQMSPGGPGRRCASFGLDAPNNIIHLVPIPPPGQ